jgi:hypothetical protein
MEWKEVALFFIGMTIGFIATHIIRLTIMTIMWRNKMKKIAKEVMDKITSQTDHEE